jgi:hypothetical protein
MRDAVCGTRENIVHCEPEPLGKLKINSAELGEANGSCCIFHVIENGQSQIQLYIQNTEHRIDNSPPLPTLPMQIVVPCTIRPAGREIILCIA